MKKNLSVRTLTEIGIFAALGFVFDALQGSITGGMFPNGGSIGFAMIAVLIIGFRRGFVPALIVGLIMGALDVVNGAYILNPMQTLLDYVLPYAFVSLACLLNPLYRKSNKKLLFIILISFVGGLGKLLSHYLAGVFFWRDQAQFAWDLNNLAPEFYSLIYNLAFVGPSIVLVAALLVALYYRAPRLLEYQLEEEEVVLKEKDSLTCTLSLAIFGLGLALFTIYVIRYCKSITYVVDYWEEQDRLKANGDYLIIFVISFIALIISIITFFKAYKGYETRKRYLIGLNLISLSSLLYAVAKVIDVYIEKEDTFFYWEWIIASSIVFAVFTLLSVLLLKKNKSTINL